MHYQNDTGHFFIIILRSGFSQKDFLRSRNEYPHLSKLFFLL